MCRLADRTGSHWLGAGGFGLQELCGVRALACVHADYARYLNLRRESAGQVWQSRFHSAPLDATACWKAVASIEIRRLKRRDVMVEAGEAGFAGEKRMEDLEKALM